MSSLSKYFGQDSAFGDACDAYTQKDFPQEIADHAATLDRSKLAYCLGFAFARALRNRQMSISDADLDQIAKNKINCGDWREFVNGFRAFKQ